MMKMRVVVFMLVLLALPGIMLGQTLSPAETRERIENQFRAAMQAWGYREFWRLWDMGMASTRFAVTREEFLRRMERGTAKPSGGGAIEAIAVELISGERGVIRARIRLDGDRAFGTFVVPRVFSVVFDEGDWRFNLYDFLITAQY